MPWKEDVEYRTARGGGRDWEKVSLQNIWGASLLSDASTTFSFLPLPPPAPDVSYILWKNQRREGRDEA